MTVLQTEYAAWRDTEKGVGQWYVHQSGARFRALMKGRQSGGTQCGIVEIGVNAMSAGDKCPKHSSCRGHVDWWVAPNYKVKDRAWRGLLGFIPSGVIKKKHEGELKLTLVNGSEISVKSADAPDSLVSEGLDFAVCDEAGQWKEDAWFRGIRPMFTATGGRALLIGTPRGKNWFYKLWLMGQPGPNKDPDYESFRWASIDSPFSDEKDIAEARKNLPSDIFRQEYEADPLDNTAGVFRSVRNCIRVQSASDPMTVIGADFARKHDFSCFIPMNSARQALGVYRSQEDWPLQKQQIAALSMRHNFARIIADDAGIGDPIVSELRSAGLQVEGINTGGPLKRTIIENLRVSFENGTIGIPDDEALINELEAYEYEVLPSGQLRYSAPEGGHDDTVIALALALWGQRGSIGMFAQPSTRTSYMGQSTGATSYMRGNRGAATWPL